MNYDYHITLFQGLFPPKKLKILNFTLTVTLSQFFYFINEITNSEKGVIY